MFMALGGACCRYPNATNNPDPSSIVPIRLRDGRVCIRAAIYQPAAEYREALVEGFTAACEVLYSDELMRRVAAERLELRFTGASPPSVTGEDSARIVKRIRAVVAELASVSIFVKWRIQRENAIAMARPPRISIQPARMKDWRSEDVATRALVVDTLVHEMSHLLLCGTQEPDCSTNPDHRYQIVQDRGHSDKNKTFSYRMGNIAAEVYIDQQSVAL